MATLNKIPCAWQGWPGAPGVTTFYTLGGSLDNDTASIRAFFNAMAAQLPSGLTIQVPGVGDTIDDGNGLINGGWNATAAPAVVTGTGLSAYAGNAGAVVHWLTAAVIAGHRVRGRTFLVPLVSTAFDTQGSIATSVLTTLRGAATTMITNMAGTLRVFHRPVGGSGGANGLVVSSSVPDLAITLRSRRI